jgi:hypothetical protein
VLSGKGAARRLVEETEAHVVVRLLLGLLLGLLSGSGVSATGGGGGGATGGGGTTTTNVGEEGLDVLAVKGLGEERSPDGLDLNCNCQLPVHRNQSPGPPQIAFGPLPCLQLTTGSRGEGGDLVTGDLETLVGEDEGRVGSSELGRLKGQHQLYTWRV